MKLPSASQTPVGAAAVGAAVTNVVMYLLTLWHSWNAVPAGVRDSVQTILTVVVAYLAAWLKVVHTPGQSFSMTLTPSPLPTLREVPLPPAQEASKV